MRTVLCQPFSLRSRVRFLGFRSVLAHFSLMKKKRIWREDRRRSEDDAAIGAVPHWVIIYHCPVSLITSWFPQRPSAMKRAATPLKFWACLQYRRIKWRGMKGNSEWATEEYASAQKLPEHSGYYSDGVAGTKQRILYAPPILPPPSLRHIHIHINTVSTWLYHASFPTGAKSKMRILFLITPLCLNQMKFCYNEIENYGK